MDLIKKKKLSVIFSFRNEASLLAELIRRTRNTLATLPNPYELIFVNDSSSDQSLDILERFAKEDNRIKIITLSRRFGYNQSFLAGLSYAHGDAAITMDADLQDPPELIPQLVKKWEQGADVVHTVRQERKGEPSSKMFLTSLAYKLIHATASIPLPENAGNFKLISRRTIKELLKLKEQDPYLRGLVCWIGFHQETVLYCREKRFSGKTHFPMFGSRSPAKEFVSGLTSFSSIPLLIAFLFSATLVIIAIGLTLHSILVPEGAVVIKGSTIIAILLLIGSIQLFCLGLLGLYIGRIWKEVAGRPNFIVASTVNTEKE